MTREVPDLGRDILAASAADLEARDEGRYAFSTRYENTDDSGFVWEGSFHIMFRLDDGRAHLDSFVQVR